MPEFLTTRGTSAEIEKIIIGAKSQLILLSPYLKISKILLERLVDASRRKVKIILIYGKDELKQQERTSLASLPTLELYFHEVLHAKCYFNETSMVITSMNMYEFSEVNNREMGILFNVKTESDLFQKAASEARSIIQNSQRVLLNSPQPLSRIIEGKHNFERKHKEERLVEIGFCIRCGIDIPANPNEPLCGKCFTSWKKYKNRDYEESFCHMCGDDSFITSMNSPFCDECEDS